MRIAWRTGALGVGWSHPLEQSIWETGGWVMVQLDDGRIVGAPVRGASALRVGAMNLYEKFLDAGVHGADQVARASLHR